MRDVFRALDANFNRAAEGLRTLEDLARFLLDEPTVVRRLKALRHQVRTVAGSLDGGRLRLLAHRDTVGDRGTTVAGPREHDRATLGDVAAAAAQRTAEALRVLEELLKLSPSAPPDAASRIETARYHLYDADKDLSLAISGGASAAARCDWCLCVLVTQTLCAPLDWLDVAKRALAGGADCLQLREKDLSTAELIRRARSLLALAKPHGASVVVNDRVDVALAAGAHGVHLGQHDLPLLEARRLAGDRLLIGVSTHNLGEAADALRNGADYAGVGAMFPTTTKVRRASGAAYLRQYLGLVAKSRPMPHLAIGGITPGNLGELLAAGCRGIAVSSVVCGSPQPERVCAALRRAIDRARRADPKPQAPRTRRTRR